MSIKDVFKKSFLEGFASGEIAFEHICACMAIAAILGIYIFFIHRLVTRKSFYDKSFGISLVSMALITAAIVITIQESIVVSLGMVGALSIVRFRNAVKSQLDLMYLFWAISVGIICGAGFAEIAFVLSFINTVVVLLLDLIPVAKAPMLVVINASDFSVDDKVITILKKYSRYTKVKTRNLSKDHLDEIIEVRIENQSDCVKELMQIEGIISVSLIDHDGEVSL